MRKTDLPCWLTGFVPGMEIYISCWKCCSPHPLPELLLPGLPVEIAWKCVAQPVMLFCSVTSDGQFSVHRRKQSEVCEPGRREASLAKKKHPSKQMHVVSPSGKNRATVCLWVCLFHASLNSLIKTWPWGGCCHVPFDFVKYQRSWSQEEHAFCTSCQGQFAFLLVTFHSSDPTFPSCSVPALGVTQYANRDLSLGRLRGPGASKPTWDLALYT